MRKENMEKTLFIKGFDKDLKCRDFQFEIGKEYKIESRNLNLCSGTVFHFCRNIQQVHKYYSCLPNEKNRFCEIEVLGDLIEDEEKCGSNHIKVVREIKGKELNILLGMINGNTGIFNTGDRNTGDWNTGDWNTGYWNTGYWNTGDRNTGYWNTGYRNTGDRNTGDWNTGYWNTGYRNTGDRNTGDWNTGDWNKCNYSTGFFNTKEQNVTIFNQPSGMFYEDFINSKYYDALASSDFTLTEWIYYTEEEKKESIIRQCIGGYLKSYTYQEACKNWWNGMGEDNRKIVMSIPNFDKKVFEEITGIKA